LSDTDSLAERADRAIAQLEDLNEQVKAELANTYRPSKADAILSGQNRDTNPDAAFDGFFRAVAMARSRDFDEQQAGKAALSAMGSSWGEPQKAVLGETDANGGYLVPRNVVSEVVEISVAVNPVRELLNTITGVSTGSAVEIPLEGPAPVRAVIAARGAIKENQSFTVGNYTATFYTMARIIDAGNQWLRQSGTAGERLIRSRLARAFGLGESYYVLSGSGTDEPKGLLTSLAAGPAGMTTAHTASDSTVAGSVRAAVAKAIEALAARGREADGVLMNPGDLAHAMVQGSDTGGFWVDSGGGSVGLIGLPGVRIRTSAAVTSKTAIAGEWRSAELYIGAEYRVDTSTEAGDRWDRNLTGFRAEEDLAFNGDPYVAAGMFQRITGLIP
jgi:HK97 family phage major capsid protein